MLSDERVLILTAYPKTPNNLKTVFEKKENSLFMKLDNPPKLRVNGWGLGSNNQPKIMEGKYLQVDKWSVLRLYRDGVFVLSVQADGNFLAWADTRTNGLKINPVALIEVVSNFVIFYKEVVDDFSDVVDNVLIKFIFSNLHKNNEKTYMCPGPIDSMAQIWSDPKYEAPQDYYTSPSLSFDFTRTDLRVIAFEIIKEIYLWFGISPNLIPYTSKEKELNIIDFEKIRTLR